MLALHSTDVGEEILVCLWVRDVHIAGDVKERLEGEHEKVGGRAC